MAGFVFFYLRLPCVVDNRDIVLSANPRSRQPTSDFRCAFIRGTADSHCQLHQIGPILPRELSK